MFEYYNDVGKCINNLKIIEESTAIILKLLPTAINGIFLVHTVKYM